MKGPLHLIVTDNLRNASTDTDTLFESGLISSRKSRLEGVFNDGVVYRIVSLEHEIRGYRPETFQIKLYHPRIKIRSQISNLNQTLKYLRAQEDHRI